MKQEDWKAFDRLEAELFPEDRAIHETFTRWVEQGGFFALESASEQLVGYLVVTRFGEDAAQLNRIGIAKSMQRQGLGTKLMVFALNWYREQGGIKQIILYVQEDNVAAQRLYRKFGFEAVATTWHYFVPFATLKPLGRYDCQPIKPDEIEDVGKQFCDALPAPQIRRFLRRDHLVITLKAPSGKIVGVCRFTPRFPGCFPFEIEQVESFDDFVAGLRPYSLSQFDYVRVTFTDNPELLQLLEKRGYKLHHKLFKMVLTLPRESS